MRRIAICLALSIPLSSLLACERGRGHTSAPTGHQEGALAVCGGPVSIQGVDVSQYDATIDWRTAATDGGIVWAIARISDGVSYPDPYFAANWVGMADAGIIRGSYQFFEAGDDITTQANMVVSAVGKLGPTDLPVAADIEDEPSGKVPTAKQLAQWMGIVEKGTGKLPIIYCGASYWNSTFGSSTEFAGNPLWVANWQVNCPDLPTIWSKWTFWQYNDTGTVAGLPGSVGGADVDVFNGSREDLLTFAANTTLTCAASAGACSKDADCCFGLTCQSGSCQTAPTACGQVQGACTSQSDCCSGLACQTWTPAGGSAGLYCCDAVGSACTSDRDCCGGTLCTNGTCACVAQSAFCQNDSDCCSGLSCQSGACQTAPSCGAIQSLCADDADCCSGLVCQIRSPSGSSSSLYCCKGDGVACTAGTECCGGMNCTNGTCACVAEGSYCENDADCCSGNTCQGQRCAPPPATSSRSSSSSTGGRSTGARSTSGRSASRSSSTGGSTAQSASTGSTAQSTSSAAVSATGSTQGASTGATSSAGASTAGSTAAGPSSAAASTGNGSSTGGSIGGPATQSTAASGSGGSAANTSGTAASGTSGSSSGKKSTTGSSPAASTGGSTGSTSKSGCASTSGADALSLAFALGLMAKRRRRPFVNA